MKKILIATILLLASLTTFSQQTLRPNIRKFKNDTIIWKQDSLLKKEDFKSKPKSNNGPLGFAATSLFIYTDDVGGRLMFYVEALFIKSKSYVTKYSEYVLKHEQLHFDICELFARKLRKKLSEIDFKKVKNIRNEIQNQFNNCGEQLRREQDKYDRETEHGLNSAKQEVWEADIKKRIAELDAYQSSGIDIAK